jgi:bifunctional DNA-binding transcriptional regulator/antitoxin component of YhaV-PrlF toxin-antitoxin module
VAEVIVMQLGPEEFRVIVVDAGEKHERTVTVPRHARQGLGLHGVPPVAIVEESVRFLLEREEPAAIPDRFVLPTIAGRYPEYPEEIRSRFG